MQVIREAKEGDEALLTRLICAAFEQVAEAFGLNRENCPSHPAFTTVEDQRRAILKGIRYFILREDGEAMGCVAWDARNAEEPWLARLSVRPLHQGKGYGKALVHHVIEEGKREGQKFILIGIIAEHHELVAWYERLGFERVAVKQYAHLPFEVLVMKQDLKMSELTEEEILRVKVEDFLADPESDGRDNPHLYVNIAEQLMPHASLLDFAEQIIKKGLEVNTLGNIKKHLGPSYAEHQQKAEFGRLYSQYAWVLYLKGQFKDAQEEIQNAIEYKTESIKPEAEDYLRLGIIDYENGHVDRGWAYVTKALLMDTLVEQKNEHYRVAIDRIVFDRHGDVTNPDVFISNFRALHAEDVPDLPLATLSGDSFRMSDKTGRVLFVNFFSPKCGSSRQELSHLKPLYNAFSSREDVGFLFILNQARWQDEAADLFREYGLADPMIVKMSTGSAYDWISAEPTIWLVNKEAKIVGRYSGYDQGDEAVYRQELLKLVEAE